MTELAAHPLAAAAAVDRAVDLKVRFQELDPNGHLNHAVYLTLFETARIEVMERLGHSLHSLRDRGVSLVVIETTVRFQRPVHAGETVTIDSRIGTLRRASGWWHQTMRCGDEVRAEADVRSTVVTDDGRPTRPPDDLVAALTALRDA